MNRENGVVIEVTGDKARVKANRHNDCQNCGSCPGDQAMIVTAENPIGAEPGDTVTFEIREQHVLKAAFVVYALPLILAFLGAWLGTAAAPLLHWGTESTQIAFGIAGFVLAVVIIKWYDRSAQATMLPVITHKV